eukprot:CAMPEP_0116844340 /NCGR_PEP_ID=MMETSP0418-20121206/12613_1 /TAXON_ID=1158023 /ORGANISM="Astrosyne radiata, Strain 13vi08-1A" /LENGTH=202 /DNA_ID=CAMNT_0004475241 /DNA_START=52 /DNA_END=660 /DNA_ORIENTATION=+
MSSALQMTTIINNNNNGHHHDWRMISTTGSDDENDASLISKTETLLKKSKKEKRRVRFHIALEEVHEIQRIHEIILLDDHDNDGEGDISSIWYSQKEFADILDEIDHDLELLTTGQVLEGEQYSMRGIESRTQAGYERKQRNKENALYAVLDEQDRQQHRRRRQTRCSREEALARVYVLETTECMEDALEQGLMDEEDAAER